MQNLQNYDRTCFVMMPYGTRTLAGRSIDFDSIYDDILVPAIRRVKVDGKSMKPLRSDRRLDSRPLVHTMVQDLLGSRMGLAELSTENMNVGYELGTRHSAVPFGTVLVHLEGTPIPFDLAQQLVVPYSEAPPAVAYASIGKIAATLRATLRSNQPDNPVYLQARTLAQRMGEPSDPTPLGRNLVDAESAAIAGRPLEAAQVFAQATELEPKNSTLHQLSGMMYIKAGEPKHAEEHFLAAIQINPLLTDARRIVSDLQNGRPPRLIEVDPLSSPALQELPSKSIRSALDAEIMAEAVKHPDRITVRMVPEVPTASGLISHVNVIAGPEVKADQIRHAISSAAGIVHEYPSMYFPESNRTSWSYDVQGLRGGASGTGLDNLRRSFSTVAVGRKIDFGSGSGGSGGFGGGNTGGIEF
jgi:hypothetical protein